MAAPATLSLKIAQAAARAIHEANKVYCEMHGDFTQKHWEAAGDEIRASALDGVMNILANPDLTPEQGHDNWVKFKVAHGWHRGDIKDESKKEHPCLVPYDELPEVQKVKDRLVIAVAKVFLGM